MAVGLRVKYPTFSRLAIHINSISVNALGQFLLYFL